MAGIRPLEPGGWIGTGLKTKTEAGPDRGTVNNTKDGTLKGSLLPGPGAGVPSRTTWKAAKLLHPCGGFTKLSVFLDLEVLDGPSYPGEAWVLLVSTLCTPFCPHE